MIQRPAISLSPFSTARCIVITYFLAAVSPPGSLTCASIVTSFEPRSPSYFVTSIGALLPPLMLRSTRALSLASLRFASETLRETAAPS